MKNPQGILILISKDEWISLLLYSSSLRRKSSLKYEIKNELYILHD